MDSGMYQCVAENKYGAVYSSAELKILGKFIAALLCAVFLQVEIRGAGQTVHVRHVCRCEICYCVLLRTEILLPICRV